ncbi:hypothetical protein ACQKMN_12385 [Ureibacillus composti]
MYEIYAFLRFYHADSCRILRKRITCIIGAQYSDFLHPIREKKNVEFDWEIDKYVEMQFKGFTSRVKGTEVLLHVTI